MTVHQNSLAAYDSEHPNLSRRAQVILNHLRSAGPRTDREVMQDLNFVEPNSVRPRITEMLRLGLLCQCGDCKCPVTGKTVRVVEAVRQQIKRSQSSLF